MIRRRFTEWELQKASADVMRACLREGAFAFHVPNERESGFQRQILAAGGTMAGVADWIILAPTTFGARCSHGCLVAELGRAFAIELKAGRNQQTSAQKGFEAMCGEAHVPYRVCRSIDEVLDALREWGLLKEGVS